MSEPKTLIIFEMVPEETVLVLVPNNVITPSLREHLNNAHMTMGNASKTSAKDLKYNSILQLMLLNDDRYFGDSCRQAKNEGIDPALVGVFGKYRIKPEDLPKENANVTAVIWAAFLL